MHLGFLLPSNAKCQRATETMVILLIFLVGD